MGDSGSGLEISEDGRLGLRLASISGDTRDSLDMEELKRLRKRMMISDAKATYREIEDWRRVEEVPSIREVAQAIDDKLGHRGWGWACSWWRRCRRRRAWGRRFPT